MPSLQFSYYQADAQGASGNQDKLEANWFTFEPSDFLLYPKMDPAKRITHCDNSIWNILYNYQGPQTDPDSIKAFGKNSMAFGQVFMRKYQMYISYNEDKSAVYYV
jgi:hypothetical protein